MRGNLSIEACHSLEHVDVVIIVIVTFDLFQSRLNSYIEVSDAIYCSWVTAQIKLTIGHADE